MKISRFLLSTILVAALCSVAPSPASAQQRPALGDNAALRYWSAFAQMQDSPLTNDQVKELNAILDGTTPYRRRRRGACQLYPERAGGRTSRSGCCQRGEPGPCHGHGV